MTTTADDELAFAGPGALAELVRAREVHPRELVELCLRRIEALEPASERVPRDDGRRGAGGGRHDGELERAARRRADRDQGRLPVAGQADDPRLAQLRPAGARGRRGGPPPARRRRDPDRDHERARADDLPVDGHRRERDHPQPVGPQPHAGRLLGRLGGRRGGRNRAVRDGLGRRRLDPDPRRVLRSGRDEADARPRLDASRRARAGSA